MSSSTVNSWCIGRLVIGDEVLLILLGRVDKNEVCENDSKPVNVP